MDKKTVKLGFTKINFDNPNELALTESNTLRRVIGILGMLLPVLLWIALIADSRDFMPMPSISHYYYTRASAVFTSIVSLLAIFLMIYRGYDPIDFIISTLAGVFSLTMIFFPTDNISNACPDPYNNPYVTILKISDFRVSLHYFSAAIFLGCLAYMSLFLFTRTGKNKIKTGRKKTRNRIYIFCGIMMVLALLIIASRLLPIQSWNDWFDSHQMTFWMETLAVESFGISWLVKGEFVLKDKPAIVT